MTVRRVVPGRVTGRATAPPSKSYTHRALVAAYLSGRPFTVDHPLDADDTQATAEAIRRLGAEVRQSAMRWTVRPGHAPSSARPIEIDCGESGTTLRFVVVLASLDPRKVRFRGSGRLGKRPMRPLFRALEALGAEVGSTQSGLPFTIRGPIHGGRVRLDASESSQFASALLLALPTRDQDSRVTLEGRIVSEPYMDATIALLRRLKVDLDRRGRVIRIPRQQRVSGRSFRVPGDASSAAYLWVAGAMTGGPVTVAGVPPELPQADRAVLDLLRRAGADVRERGGLVSVRRGKPRAFSFDLTASPDLYPLAGVLAASLPGRSTLRGAAHVVHKESNRRTETARLARAFGSRVRSVPSGLEIDGGRPLQPIDLVHLTDHRVVMSAAVGALSAVGPSRVGVAEAVRKSYPEFWTTLSALGAEVGVA
jgi:3-phosphoshikimate 1-carboxyvinyltransferase